MGGFSWSHLLSPITYLFKSKPNPEIEAIREADHTYIRGHESQRSPCPFQSCLQTRIICTPPKARSSTTTDDSRVRRDKEEKVVGHGAGVTFLSNLRLWVTMWSQTCILLQTFGKLISVEDIKTFYEEEKLPEWGLKDTVNGKKRVTFHGLLGDVAAVFWEHLFVKMPDAMLKDALRGW